LLARALANLCFHLLRGLRFGLISVFLCHILLQISLYLLDHFSLARFHVHNTYGSTRAGVRGVFQDEPEVLAGVPQPPQLLPRDVPAAGRGCHGKTKEQPAAAKTTLQRTPIAEPTLCLFVFLRLIISLSCCAHN
jgi:hypothetical protein